jgi:hypothetical protein
MILLNLLFLISISSHLADCNTDKGAPLEASTVENSKSVSNTDGMKLKITVGESIHTATLIDSKITKDFIALLPLNLSMNDLLDREKYASLPKAISTEGKRVYTYKKADIAYWSPGKGVAIFYKNDGQSFQARELLS